jgi:hypothetical protein
MLAACLTSLLMDTEVLFQWAATKECQQWAMPVMTHITQQELHAFPPLPSRLVAQEPI